MARGDGIDRTSARNMRLTTQKLKNAQQHNEREKDSYVNPDIVPERSHLNVHFKKPDGSYLEQFEQMEAAGVISTRGLKEAEMVQVADFIERGVEHREDEAALRSIGNEVKEFMAAFPMPRF